MVELQHVHRIPFYTLGITKTAIVTCSIRADHTWKKSERSRSELVLCDIYTYVCAYVYFIKCEKHGSESGRAVRDCADLVGAVVWRVCYLYKIHIYPFIYIMCIYINGYIEMNVFNRGCIC